MLKDYTYTAADGNFYREKIFDRLPDKIWDVHQHMSLPEHIENIPEEMVKSDWAIQCGMAMSWEEYQGFAKNVYQGKTVYTTTFGNVMKGGRHAENNRYIADLLQSKKLSSGLLVLDPAISAEETARLYDRGGFSGFKPYADMVAGQKAADISFTDFMPDAHMQFLNERKGALMLHVPRAGRLPDDRNIKELLELRQKFPDINIIIAHMGRCYCVGTFREALGKLGGHINEFHFDLAAVINPEVIETALERLDHTHIHYGTDLPVFWWHGKRRWTEDKYYNLSREDFPWNRHEDAANEKSYTLFLYEQLNNILDVTGEDTDPKELREKIFYSNSVKLFGTNVRETVKC